MSSYRYVTTDHWMKRSEQDVHNLFNRYEKELWDRRLEMDSEIDNWRRALIQQIDNHAQEQKRLVDEEYRKQESYINDTRQQLINAACSHETRGENEQIRQLLEQCKSLKIELAPLEFSENQNPFIQFMTEEKRAQKNRDAQKREDNKFRDKIGGAYGNDDANNTNAYPHSSSKSSSTNAKQANQPSTATNPTNTYDRPMSGSNNQNSQAIAYDDSDGQCPICTMIFSPNMSMYDRHTHIDAHLEENS